jgi:hypothetical protein
MKIEKIADADKTKYMDLLLIANELHRHARAAGYL